MQFGNQSIEAIGQVVPFLLTQISIETETETSLFNTT